jgi:hypothetical protein
MQRSEPTAWATESSRECNEYASGIMVLGFPNLSWSIRTSSLRVGQA